MNEIIQTIAIYALPVIFAITLHEAAHAYAAKYFGDLTAYSQGRMSLNPVRHIDPFGTILIPLLLALLSSPFIFGYAKPVPVDFSRLRNPKKQMAWVALAGPLANLLMAFFVDAVVFCFAIRGNQRSIFPRNGGSWRENQPDSVRFQSFSIAATGWWKNRDQYSAQSLCVSFCAYRALWFFHRTWLDDAEFAQLLDEARHDARGIAA